MMSQSCPSRGTGHCRHCPLALLPPPRVSFWGRTISKGGREGGDNDTNPSQCSSPSGTCLGTPQGHHAVTVPVHLLRGDSPGLGGDSPCPQQRWHLISAEVFLARSFYACIIFLPSHVKLEVYEVAGSKIINLLMSFWGQMVLEKRTGCVSWHFSCHWMAMFDQKPKYEALIKQEMKTLFYW